MQKAPQVAYRNLTPSEEITGRVLAKVEKLERYFQRIIGCKVMLEGPGRHHATGKHFRVRIELSVPGERLVVGRNPPRNEKHQDLDATIDAAFREAKRQLEDHARRFDHRVRAQAREEPARGRVKSLFRAEGYGFLETPDGREVYFDARSVLDDAFPRLRPGSPVRFAEEMGNEGPQASSVARAGRERRTA